ncbi:hypothetical protein EAF00_003815 [Botryotinia globosa]|nr:hypothetical protein EAF00_003815 [Botryotinia globosa]
MLMVLPVTQVNSVSTDTELFGYGNYTRALQPFFTTPTPTTNNQPPSSDVLKFRSRQNPHTSESLGKHFYTCLPSKPAKISCAFSLPLTPTSQESKSHPPRSVMHRYKSLHNPHELPAQIRDSSAAEPHLRPTTLPQNHHLGKRHVYLDWVCDQGASLVTSAPLLSALVVA